MDFKIILFTILFGLVSWSDGSARSEPQHAPPVPGLPESIDSIKSTAASSVDEKPKLLTNYIPAAMQALHYYSDIMQYDLSAITTTIEPPFTGTHSSGEVPIPSSTTPVTTSSTTKSTARPTSPWWPPPTTATTKAPTTTTTTTKRSTTIWWPPPTTTATTKRTTTSWWTPTTTQRPTTNKRTTTRRPTTTTSTSAQETTPFHRPGYYGPEKPPRPPTIAKPTLYLEKPEQSYQRPSQIKPSSFFSTDTDSDKQFFNWFFQTKPKQLQRENENDLQLLDPLPKALLQDIEYEKYELPAVLDEDNVNEFLKLYDDSYGRNHPVTGKKKVPPTKPYVEMLMLYDLLKRDAKTLMLHQYAGYSDEMYADLVKSSSWSAERQLHFILSKMIERKDTNRQDVIVRATSMIKDLENPNSITAKTMHFIPTLKYEL